jgi:hypothetical protein
MTHWDKIKILTQLVRKAYVAHQDSGQYHTAAQQLWFEKLALLDPQEVATLPASLHKKMRWYMVDCRFLGELLAQLVSKPLDDKAVELIMLVAVMGAVSDLMVDEMRVNSQDIQHILMESKQPSPNASVIEHIFFIFRDSAYKLISPESRNLILAYGKTATKAQIDSTGQLEGGKTLQQIEKIAYDKGGLAAVLIGCVVTPDFVNIAKPVYEVGGLIQLLNDAQDMHKDVRENIVTFVRFQSSFSDIAHYLDKERQRVFAQFQHLPYPKKGVEQFVFSMTLLQLGILFKLYGYKRVCQNDLNFNKIALIPKEKFRISPFSGQALGLFFKEIHHFQLKTAHEAMRLDMF